MDDTALDRIENQLVESIRVAAPHLAQRSRESLDRLRWLRRDHARLAELVGRQNTNCPAWPPPYLSDPERVIPQAAGSTS